MVHGADERPSELIIHGRVYDVSGFIKRHPGGSVIRYMLDRDASHAYDEFHQRSESADKFLASLPSRPVEATDVRVDRSAVMADYEKLRRDLVAEGFFEPSLVHVVWRFAQLALLSVLGVWLLLNGWVVSGVLVMGLMQGQSGWLQHECGHYSLTGKVGLDQLLHELLFGVFSSMSASWWRKQHNKHHARPQQLDADVLPEQQASLWIKFQAFHYFPMLEMLALFWSFYLQPRHVVRTKRYREGVFMAMNHGYRLALGVAATGSVWGTLAVYFGIQTVQAMYLFGHFTVSHTHLPVLAADEDLCWVEHTLRTTMNIESSWWCDWIMGYLNLQIEHHLFPSMPQFRFSQVSPRIRALAEKHGIPYLEDSYVNAFYRTIANLHHVGQSAGEAQNKTVSYDAVPNVTALKRNLHS
ncbi:delta-5 desaturase [Thecamonas trahens ATCC 50062]|uniref:Delta-5 desaturase n=1 Tax=Thecamonas trahens ATCC 50062 TaxID=461836 RepID=A0A0L0DP34_THETB|nr:delta-5 desaturase [Thecamonas trahens ATCC 50062]KNC53791.1 delta-5 desaturase [Thecamonas trahens ATCC 50062]|eukprot:XP_013754352.1 delta-5 desaturase [Thecamonas trahens ATCC 50062]